MLAELLEPPPPGVLEIYAVSKAVNNVRANTADLIQPLEETGVDQ